MRTWSGHSPSDPPTRFWAKVARGEPDACWEWTAARDRRGYGRFKVRQQSVKAHRFAYAAEHGAFEPGWIVCHSCDNPPCCNPGHLFLGTHASNAQDKVAKGRGPYGEANPSARLTSLAVVEMRKLRCEGATLSALGAAFGVSTAHAGRICRGLNWKVAGDNLAACAA